MTIEDYLLETGMSMEEWNQWRAQVNANKEIFLKQYDIDHACCPHCGHEGHSSTYMGFCLCIDQNGEVEKGYKDENHVQCSQCKWVGTTHDLMPRRSGELDA